MEKSLNSGIFYKAVFFKIFMLSLMISLSACVTQNFENDEPVVQNQASRDEMAATRISLGLGYLRIGNMAQAKANLEKAKFFSPKMVQVYTSFAHYYSEVGEHELTIASYEKALELKSDDPDTLNNYGVYLCRNEELDKAEEQFLKAIAVPSYILVSQSYENLSSCFLKNDRFEKAEMYLTKALNHSPNSASVLIALVRLEYAMGNYKKAKNYGQKFEKVTRRFTPESLALSYKVNLKLRKFKTAKNYASMLVKMYPQSWESKQYILNKLETIEADGLAERYRLMLAKTNKTTPVSDPSKRVFKLSPNKKRQSVVTPSNVSSKKDTVLSSTAVTNLASPLAVNTASNSIVLPVASAKPPVKNTATTFNASSGTISTAEVPRLAANTKVHVPPTKDNSVIDELVVAKTPEQIAQAQQIKDAELKKNIEDKEALLNDVFLQQTEEKAKASQKSAVKTHIVSSGETLYRVSIKYNVRIDVLRKWNNLSEKNGIRSGQTLYVSNPN